LEEHVASVFRVEEKAEQDTSMKVSGKEKIKDVYLLGYNAM
jgi:hypothetical protein